MPPVDLDGIAGRIAPFPVPENRFGQIAGAVGDRVVWTVLPIAGAHGRGGHKESPGRLEVFDFETLRVETLMEKADGFALAADHTTLVVREGKRLRAIAGGAQARARARSRTSLRGTVAQEWLDRPRSHSSVGRAAQRVAADAARGVAPAARPVLGAEHVGRRLGRQSIATTSRSSTGSRRALNSRTSSGKCRASSGRRTPTKWAATTGVRRRSRSAISPPTCARSTDGSYEITRIVTGDPWDAGADSPLNAVGVEAKSGERIVAVNGQRTSRERPPQSLLVHQAGTKVELTLAAGGGAPGSTRNVVVTTLADEVPARYREWVERNRAGSTSTRGGRVGYFHLPDMMSAGFAEFHRYFITECDRDALIVDVRYNRGGHVSQLLLEKVARKRIGYDLSRWGRPESYPNEAVAGPVVALTNEHAGSDGDIFSHGFKLMGIGPLVGTRTWGGVIGIWPRHRLVDGTETTQPEYSFWFQDVGWGVENYGTDPQIEVDNAPHDAAAGRDRQLETALATALQLIERIGAAKPQFEPRPNLARGPLPPRKR